MNLEEELSELRERLLDGTVAVGDYHYFTIHDPKERVICAASFRERVLHHAIMNVCEPVFESYQIHDSYACRKGKGVDACLGRLRQMCRKYDWYLKLDISKYFDSIPHDILKRILARHVKDRRVLDLFGRLVDSYETVEGRGIPIGNLTSQHFANMYLGVMDHRIKDVWKVPGYVRYMDDFVLFFNEREKSGELLERVRRFLRDELSLELNAPQFNATSRGLPALSYRVFGNCLRLSLKAARRFKRKMTDAVANGARERILPLLAFIDRAETAGFKACFMARLAGKAGG